MLSLYCHRALPNFPYNFEFWKNIVVIVIENWAINNHFTSTFVNIHEMNGINMAKMNMNMSKLYTTLHKRNKFTKVLMNRLFLVRHKKKYCSAESWTHADRSHTFPRMKFPTLFPTISWLNGPHSLPILHEIVWNHFNYREYFKILDTWGHVFFNNLVLSVIKYPFLFLICVIFSTPSKTWNFLHFPDLLIHFSTFTDFVNQFPTFSRP